VLMVWREGEEEEEGRGGSERRQARGSSAVSLSRVVGGDGTAVDCWG